MGVYLLKECMLSNMRKVLFAMVSADTSKIKVIINNNMKEEGYGIWMESLRLWSQISSEEACKPFSLPGQINFILRNILFIYGYNHPDN